ncbi:MAG TPA: hypothetical protein VLA73_01905 [Burkholderiales bacterium]|nr:hypothetical protein [Burkholderiales bacterium]
MLIKDGTRDGLPVPPQEKLSATFSKLEFTHGYNLFTLNLVRRSSFRAKALVAGAGAGAGIAIPYVEVGRTGWPMASRTSEYQMSGPAAQVLGGVEWHFAPHFSLFIEYKLSCAAIRGAVKRGRQRRNQSVYTSTLGRTRLASQGAVSRDTLISACPSKIP